MIFFSFTSLFLVTTLRFKRGRVRNFEKKANSGCKIAVCVVTLSAALELTWKLKIFKILFAIIY
jgi:hypothetical protein